jgi:hypothetical protein
MSCLMVASYHIFYFKVLTYRQVAGGVDATIGQTNRQVNIKEIFNVIINVMHKLWIVIYCIPNCGRCEIYSRPRNLR